MAYIIIPALITLSLAATPPVDLRAKAKDPLSCLRANHALIIIADSHGGDDPHDPRDDDPHQEDPRHPSTPHSQIDPGDAPANKYGNPLPPDDPYSNYQNPLPGRPY